MTKKYIVTLTDEERQYLEQFTTTGKRGARQLNHARILLKADINHTSGGWCDTDIKDALDVSLRTIERVRQRFVEEGLERRFEKFLARLIKPVNHDPNHGNVTEDF